MEYKNLALLFNNFKDDSGKINYCDMVRIMNIISIDINKLTVQEKYTYDDFLYQIKQLLNNYPIKITKKKFSAKLKGQFDKNTTSFIIDSIFNDTTEIDVNSITLYKIVD